MYNFKCKHCNHTQEILMLGVFLPKEREGVVNTDPEYAEDCCINCGKRDWYSLLSTPARHESWTTGHHFGVEGKFSVQLGRHVSGNAEERKLMEAKGYMLESDQVQHYYEDTVEKLDEEDAIIDDMCESYQTKLDNGMTEEAAILEVLPADKCLNGDFDFLAGSGKTVTPTEKNV